MKEPAPTLTRESVRSLNTNLRRFISEWLDFMERWEMPAWEEASRWSYFCHGWPQPFPGSAVSMPVRKNLELIVRFAQLENQVPGFDGQACLDLRRILAWLGNQSSARNPSQIKAKELLALVEKVVTQVDLVLLKLDAPANAGSAEDEAFTVRGSIDTDGRVWFQDVIDVGVPSEGIPPIPKSTLHDWIRDSYEILGVPSQDKAQRKKHGQTKRLKLLVDGLIQLARGRLKQRP